MTHSTMMRVSAFAWYALALLAVTRMTACGGPPAGTGGAGGTRTATGTPPSGSGGAGGTQTSTGTPSAGTGGAGGTQTSTGTQAACPPGLEEPCMRYRILLVGNPSTDVALRNKYIAAFGSACYMSEVDTFDCFYQKWQDACADAVKIGEVSGNAPYDKGYMCQPDGAGNYTLQIGPDVANVTYINYQNAPRQTPLTDINGVPTEVSGPYRNLVEVTAVEPGKDFNDDSGMVDADGGALKQRTWVLQVNKNANDGGVRSDLAGFKFPCEDQDGGLTTCTEPDFLPDPEDISATYPNVHHVVPMQDKRCCPWGTNSYKNAAVISSKLNGFFTNNNPPTEEVKQLNSTNAYPP